MLRGLLWPASFVYQGVARARARCYRHGIFRQRRLAGAVISVGNLTLGGTGKTPMVMWVAERLLEEGHRVGILTRGYRGRRPPEESGAFLSDEVAMLRARLGKQAQFGIGADRHAKGLMLERHGVEWFVLDDGFQHLQLARDADVVLLDSTNPLGGGLLFPAGRLREPKSALARADIVVITRSDHAPAVEAVVRRETTAPIFYARTKLVNVAPVAANPVDPSHRPAPEAKCFAFCALGNPAAFFHDLRLWGFRVVGQAAYRDHHRFTARDAGEITRRALATGAEALVCTEKDTYNLDPDQFQPWPVFFCSISLDLPEAARFWQAVKDTVRRKRAATRQ